MTRAHLLISRLVWSAVKTLPVSPAFLRQEEPTCHQVPVTSGPGSRCASWGEGEVLKESPPLTNKAKRPEIFPRKGRRQLQRGRVLAISCLNLTLLCGACPCLQVLSGNSPGPSAGPTRRGSACHGPSAASTLPSALPPLLCSLAVSPRTTVYILREADKEFHREGGPLIGWSCFLRSLRVT